MIKPLWKNSHIKQLKTKCGVSWGTPRDIPKRVFRCIPQDTLRDIPPIIPRDNLQTISRGINRDFHQGLQQGITIRQYSELCQKFDVGLRCSEGFWRGFSEGDVLIPCTLILRSGFWTEVKCFVYSQVWRHSRWIQNFATL